MTVCHQSCLDAELIRVLGDWLASGYRKTAADWRASASRILLAEADSVEAQAERAHEVARGHIELKRRGVKFGVLTGDGERYAQSIDDDLALGRRPVPCRLPAEVTL